MLPFSALEGACSRRPSAAKQTDSAVDTKTLGLSGKWGKGGVRAIELASREAVVAEDIAIAMQADRKILVVTRYDDINLALLRFAADGSLDQTFGDSGGLFLPLPPLATTAKLSVDKNGAIRVAAFALGAAAGDSAPDFDNARTLIGLTISIDGVVESRKEVALSTEKSGWLALGSKAGVIFTADTLMIAGVQYEAAKSRSCLVIASEASTPDFSPMTLDKSVSCRPGYTLSTVGATVDSTGRLLVATVNKLWRFLPTGAVDLTFGEKGSVNSAKDEDYFAKGSLKVDGADYLQLGQRHLKTDGSATLALPSFDVSGTLEAASKAAPGALIDLPLRPIFAAQNYEASNPALAVVGTSGIPPKPQLDIAISSTNHPLFQTSLPSNFLAGAVGFTSDDRAVVAGVVAPVGSDKRYLAVAQFAAADELAAGSASSPSDMAQEWTGVPWQPKSSPVNALLLGGFAPTPSPVVDGTGTSTTGGGSATLGTTAGSTTFGSTTGSGTTGGSTTGGSTTGVSTTSDNTMTGGTTGPTPSCGNGIVEGDEICDAGMNGDANCYSPIDEQINATVVDDPLPVGDTERVTFNPPAGIKGCTPKRCGDGIIQAGEQCDVGGAQYLRNTNYPGVTVYRPDVGIFREAGCNSVTCQLEPGVKTWAGVDKQLSPDMRAPYGIDPVTGLPLRMVFEAILNAALNDAGELVSVNSPFVINGALDDAGVMVKVLGKTFVAIPKAGIWVSFTGNVADWRIAAQLSGNTVSVGAATFTFTDELVTGKVFELNTEKTLDGITNYHYTDGRLIDITPPSGQGSAPIQTYSYKTVAQLGLELNSSLPPTTQLLDKVTMTDSAGQTLAIDQFSWTFNSDGFVRSVTGPDALRGPVHTATQSTTFAYSVGPNGGILSKKLTSAVIPKIKMSAFAALDRAGGVGIWDFDKTAGIYEIAESGSVAGRSLTLQNSNSITLVEENDINVAFPSLCNTDLPRVLGVTGGIYRNAFAAAAPACDHRRFTRYAPSQKFAVDKLTGGTDETKYSVTVKSYKSVLAVSPTVGTDFKGNPDASIVELPYQEGTMYQPGIEYTYSGAVANDKTLAISLGYTPSTASPQSRSANSYMKRISSATATYSSAAPALLTQYAEKIPGATAARTILNCTPDSGAAFGYADTCTMPLAGVTTKAIYQDIGGLRIKVGTQSGYDSAADYFGEKVTLSALTNGSIQVADHATLTTSGWLVTGSEGYNASSLPSTVEDKVSGLTQTNTWDPANLVISGVSISDKRWAKRFTVTGTTFSAADRRFAKVETLSPDGTRIVSVPTTTGNGVNAAAKVQTNVFVPLSDTISAATSLTTSGHPLDERTGSEVSTQSFVGPVAVTTNVSNVISTDGVLTSRAVTESRSGYSASTQDNDSSHNEGVTHTAVATYNGEDLSTDARAVVCQLATEIGVIPPIPVGPNAVACP